jgi:hypothetical protein
LHELIRIVLWLHSECDGCCHHFDVGLQGISCRLAEGYREYEGLCCGCTVNVVVAVIIVIWGCKVQVVHWQKGIGSVKDCAVAAL